MRTFIYAVNLLLAASLALASDRQLPVEVWQAHAETVRQMSGLTRFYALKGKLEDSQDMAGSPSALRLQNENDVGSQCATGRVAGITAVLLDSECFAADALEFTTNAFTVALWLRPLGMGTKTGNNSANGMIVCNGSGYYDGWRLAIYNWKSCQPTIDIGRTNGAFSVTSAQSLNPGFWNHLAATWNGHTLRIYVNGMLSAEKDYNGAYVQPKDFLRVGYANYGVGSLRMVFDELATFGRALQPAEIAELSMPGVPLQSALRGIVNEIQSARLLNDNGARARLSGQQLADHPDAETEWKIWGALSAVGLKPDSSPTCKKNDITTCSALFRDPNLPNHLRGHAAGFLVRTARAGVSLCSVVLERLPEQMEMDAEEQRFFGLALAQAYMREDKQEMAAQVFNRLLEFDSDPHGQAEVRKLFASALYAAKRMDEARHQVSAIFHNAVIPPHIRCMAALSLAQICMRENDQDEALRTLLSAAAITNAPAHLRAEAEQLASACVNRAAGRPVQDHEASRQRLRQPPEPSVVYFIAPKGSDSNNGSFESPFATLERARDAIRAQRIRGALPAGGATVYLRGGTYAVKQTFTLTEIDSGNFGAPVVYRAWNAEKPVFDGGFRVRKLRKVRDSAILNRLPPEARGKVYAANVMEQGYDVSAAPKGYGFGISNQTVRELYQDGVPLQPARWPNNGTIITGNVTDSTNLTFACAESRLRKWGDASDMMVSGHWYHLWAHCTAPSAADTASGTITLKEKPGNYGIAADRPFYVLNLLEELDSPGEWFLDRDSGMLYVWPVKHPWFSEITLSRFEQPFIAASGVRELMIHGLTLQHGQQHGITLERCINTVVSGNVIRRFGGTALQAMHTANLRVYGNIMHTLGHTGMRISGGNRKNLTSGQMVIENNNVHSFGRCSRTYNPALHLEGCGARVAHNHFCRGPSSAMRIEGNDHLIEYNLIEHVVQESDDQGGIDMWGDPSYRGVVIRFNRWRDIGGGQHTPCGQAAIRFDDAISGMLVYGNRFERSSNGNFGAVQIHGGHHNIIDRNLFVDCRHGISFSPWGQSRWEQYLKSDRIAALTLTNVNVRLPPYSKRYPELAGLGNNADFNSVWRNRFVGVDNLLHKQPNQTEVWDNRVSDALSDMDGATFDPTFPPLPLELTGLYDDPMRAAE
ncbi:MAG: right-handed parallel beta-helix repeat-containing protein [Kiritimatiellae bacterium]|nr:right-handed parallel beta-helix repeat-containing protein [Kiritimatiellia bacterium]